MEDETTQSGVTSRRVRITGRVQGVGYRAWTEGRARGLKLDGWVRNLGDGSVEALFSGEAASVEAMIEACRKGPRNAIVDDVETLAEDEPAEPGFTSRPTL